VAVHGMETVIGGKREATRSAFCVAHGP
jgi:hypothetical protein